MPCSSTDESTHSDSRIPSAKAGDRLEPGGVPAIYRLRLASE